MNRLFTVSIIASLLLGLIPSVSFSDGVISTGQKTAKDGIVPHIINGYVYETASEKALETAQEDKVSRMEHSASEDLLVGDYPGAVVVYTKLTHMNSIDISYKENLAYALLGMGRKAQALQVLHNAFYAKGFNLYTSGRNRRAYATYALLEDEAGNWKEAVLAYQLAGAYGQVNGEIMKTDNHGCPNIDLVFSQDTPNPTLLAAAAHAVIGNALSSPLIQVNSSDGYNHAYDPAIAQFQQAVSLAPTWSTGWFYFGRVLQTAHRYQQALTAFDQSIKYAGTDKKVVKQIEGDMDWQVVNLADAKRKAVQTGVSAPAPAH